MNQPPAYCSMTEDTNENESQLICLETFLYLCNTEYFVDQDSLDVDQLGFSHSLILIAEDDSYAITARFGDWICIRIDCRCKEGCTGYHYIYIRQKLELFEMIITVVHGKTASDYFYYRFDEYDDYVYRDDFTFGMLVNHTSKHEFTHVDPVIIKNNDGFDASIEEGDIFGALHLWRGMNWKQKKIKSARMD